MAGDVAESWVLTPLHDGPPHDGPPQQPPDRHDQEIHQDKDAHGPELVQHRRVDRRTRGHEKQGADGEPQDPERHGTLLVPLVVPRRPSWSRFSSPENPRTSLHVSSQHEEGLLFRPWLLPFSEVS